jgi:hypothetical protein
MNGNTCMAIGTGSVTLEDKRGRKHTLTNVHYVPDAESSLISFVPDMASNQVEPRSGIFQINLINLKNISSQASAV